MTAITRRQADILRVVFTARRLHVRGIADKLGSPNRLRGDLGELVQKRYLLMEHAGKEHLYTMTKLGLRRLLKYEAETAEASIATLIDARNQIKGQQIAIAGFQKLLAHIIEPSCAKCGASGEDVEYRYDRGSGEYDNFKCHKCGSTEIAELPLEGPIRVVPIDAKIVPHDAKKERDQNETEAMNR